MFCSRRASQNNARFKTWFHVPVNASGEKDFDAFRRFGGCPEN
jgi:hypothetical protein